MTENCRTLKSTNQGFEEEQWGPGCPSHERALWGGRPPRGASDHQQGWE